MLTKRLTEPRRVVSLHDPAIDPIDFQKIKAYSTSRNIDDLGDLSELEDKMTVFKLSPMLPKFQHLETMLDRLFAAHCVGCEDGPLDESDFDEKDGRRFLKIDSLDKLPRRTVIELGQIVWELASVDGGASPFSSPGIELVNQIRDRQSHRALRAIIDTVKKPRSEQSTSTNSTLESEAENAGPSTPNP